MKNITHTLFFNYDYYLKLNVGILWYQKNFYQFNLNYVLKKVNGL